MPMAADTAAAGPERMRPTAAAATIAGAPNGSARCTSSRSGSILTSAGPPIPQPHRVDRDCDAQHHANREEDVLRADQPVRKVPKGAQSKDPCQQCRSDGPPDAHPRPSALRVWVDRHERGQYMRTLSAASKPSVARFRRSEYRWGAARERFHEGHPISLAPARAAPSWRGPGTPTP